VNPKLAGDAVPKDGTVEELVVDETLEIGFEFDPPGVCVAPN